MAKRRESNVITGDCRQVLATIDDASVDLVFADPPFNINYTYDGFLDNMTHAEFLQFSQEWLNHVYRILKPTGSFWLAMGDEHVADLQQLITRGDVGGRKKLKMRNWVVWHYRFGVYCTHKLARTHTHILHFVKSEKNHKFFPDEVRVPSARQLEYDDSRANPNGRLPADTWLLDGEKGAHFNEDSNTWEASRVCGTFKARAPGATTQMPEQILARIIRLCTEENDFVVDPFAGASGSTACVAKKLGRRFLTSELVAATAASARTRVAAVAQGDPIS